MRFCVDYRRLNAVTKKAVYPIPRIDDTLDHLTRAKYLSVMDLTSGYWQIPMAPEDIEKTAFVCHRGLFEFVVVPFGLTNAPATFQSAMEIVLAGLNWVSCLVYVDDIIVFSPSFDAHLHDLQNVFDRIRGANMWLKPKKCNFCCLDVSYLGHVVGNGVVKPSPGKVSAITQCHTPKNPKELRQFLGMVGYYRGFIPHFSDLAAPLNQLLKKDATWCWTVAQRGAFKELRDALIKHPVLRLPDFNKPFFLHTDASNVAIGAVLSQLDNDGKEYAVSYASRSLTKSEQNYDTTRKECLAVLQWIKHFRPYLHGRPFTVVTDHRALLWLLRSRSDSTQLTRWCMELQAYDFQIVHRAGKKHQNADALSRPPFVLFGDGLPLADTAPVSFQSLTEVDVIAAAYNECVGDEPLPEPDEYEEFVAASTCARSADVIGPNGDVTSHAAFKTWTAISIRQAQLDDPLCQPILACMEERVLPSDDRQARYIMTLATRMAIIDGCLFHLWWPTSSSSSIRTHTRTQLVVPTTLQEELLTFYHDEPLSAHMGQQRTFERMRDLYWWPSMWQDVRHWVESCVPCQQRKRPAKALRAPMQPIQTDYIWQRVGVDIMGPLPTTDSGNCYILSFTDYFSKWVESFPMPDQKARTVARLFVEQILCRHTAPSILLSDRGKQFTSKLLHHINELLCVRKHFTTPYHPQTDGQVERFNSTLQAMLSMYVREEQTNWDEFLPYVLCAYRTAVHETTGTTPFFLMFSRDPTFPVDVQFRLAAQLGSAKDGSRDMIKRLETARSRVAEEICKAGTRSKLLYDRRVSSTSLPLGTEVMLFATPTGKKRTRKLQRCWRGPYKVIEVLSDLNYHIQSCANADDCQVVHLNHLKLFRKYDGLKGGSKALPVASKESSDSLSGRRMEAPPLAKMKEEEEIEEEKEAEKNQPAHKLTRTEPKKRRLAKRRRKGLKANELKEGKPLEQQDQEVAIEEETQGTDGEEYEVEAIKDMRNGEDGVEYLVKWKGYTPRHNRWVKEQNLHCDDLLVEFLRQRPSSNNEKSKQAKGKEKEVD